MTTEIVKIWNEFHKELRTYIARTIRNQEDTDDVMQDVFVKIILNIEKVKNAENLRKYLYGIVRNTIRDYFNNLARNRNKIPDYVVEEESELLNRIIASKLKSFIDQIPEKYKEALLLTEFQDISQKELAEILNISYSGAKSRVQRGKEKLKAELLACCVFQSDIYGNIMEVKQKTPRNW
jgi:RNA polymerase sigma-70 factor (ECF subfamily)